MMRWYGSKNGLHISRKSRFLMVGITMSSSSFSNGVGTIEAASMEAIVKAERGRERERRKR